MLLGCEVQYYRENWNEITTTKFYSTRGGQPLKVYSKWVSEWDTIFLRLVSQCKEGCYTSVAILGKQNMDCPGCQHNVNGEI